LSYAATRTPGLSNKAELGKNRYGSKSTAELGIGSQISERQIEGMARLSPTISWNESNGLKSSAEPPEGNDRCASHLELRSFLTTI